MSETIKFTVWGEAKPAGSKRAFAIRRNGIPTRQIAVTDANPKSKSWKQEVSAAAFNACRGRMIDGPLKVTMNFYRPRPKCHFGAKGMSKKGMASTAPTMKPDVLKLARGVEDAMSGVVYRDDSQIVVEVLTKNWGETARCEVTIEAVE